MNRYFRMQEIYQDFVEGDSNWRVSKVYFIDNLVFNLARLFLPL